MITFLMGVLFVLGVLACPVPALGQVGENYILEVEGRYWRPKLDATFRIVESGVGVDVNAVNDLVMPEHSDFGEVRVQVKAAKRHKFNFSYLPMKWEGDTFMSRTIEFAGEIFTQGTRVRSSLELDFLKVGYEYDFVVGKYGFAGALVDIYASYFKVRIDALPIAENHEESGIIPLGMIGLTGRFYPLPWIHVTGKIAGLPLGGFGHLLDAEATVGINPIKYVGISAGYRYLDMKGQYLDNLVSFTLSGPFAALEVRF